MSCNDPARGFSLGNKQFRYMSRILQYIKDTRGEMQHVAWPTQTQTFVYTALVIVISIATALYLGLFDFLFTSSLDAGLDTIAPQQESSLPLEVSTTPQQPAFEIGGIEVTPVDGEGDAEVNIE